MRLLLKNHPPVSLSDDAKERLKKRILANLSCQNTIEKRAHAGILAHLHSIASSLAPSPEFRSLLREKLLTLVEFESNRRSSVSRVLDWLKGHRRFSAGALALLFLISIFFNFTLDLERAEASFFTAIEEVQGTVEVLRSGKTLSAGSGFVLKANDVLSTGPSSKAVVRFLDDSVSRLDENTEVKISQLFVNPNNKTETIVELILMRGRLWSRVINLINKLSRFQVQAANTVTVAKRKAAFDVSVAEKGKAKVAAHHNTVDMVVATKTKVVETSLAKGFEAEVKTQALSPLAITIASAAEKEPSSEEDKTWIQDNLNQDKKYIAAVKQEAQDSLRDQVKVAPGTPLHALKELSETTNIALTVSDFEKQKKILSRAQTILAESEALIEKGDQEGTKKLIEEFSYLIDSLFRWIIEHETTNSAEALALKSEVSNALSAYEKQLTVILPTDALYTIKIAISQAQLGGAQGSAEKTEERLDLAVDKLLEAHDLVEQGDHAAAKLQVEEYTKAVDAVISEVKELPQDEREKAVSSILENKAEDIKVLEAMSAASPHGDEQITPAADSSATPVPPSPGQESSADSSSAPGTSTAPQTIEQSVTQAKTDTLVKLGEVVLEIQKNQPSPNVADKLKNIQQADLNGKSIVDLQLSRNKVIIRTDSQVISVTGTTTPIITPTPPKEDSKKPEAPQAQP